MTSPERLSIALTDRYRIERELGAVGMATVCRVITRTITEPARPVNEFRKNVGLADRYRTGLRGIRASALAA